MGGGGGNIGHPPVISATAPPQGVPPFGQIGNNPATTSQLGQGTPTKAGSQGQLPALDAALNTPVGGTPVFPNSMSFPQPPVYGFGSGAPGPVSAGAAAATPAPAPAAPPAPVPAPSNEPSREHGG